MTKKLFYEDSFRKSFEASVTGCGERDGKFWIELDETVFFPEGGGQSSDTGTLVVTANSGEVPAAADGSAGGRISVSDVREKNGHIYHVADAPIPAGARVYGEINWDERFSKMQQHSGEHIVSGIVHSTYGYNNVGFHLAKDYVTLDFDGPLTKEQLREIEYRANQAAVSNVPIEVSYPAKEALAEMDYRSKIEIEGQVRIVTIPGYDVCACCAPHVNKTGEIGIIKFVNMQNYKGGVRITMQCGFRALLDYNKKEAGVQAISNTLSVKEDEVFAAVEHLKEEIYRLNCEKENVFRELLSYKAEKIVPAGEMPVVFESGLDGSQMREYVNLLLQKEIAGCVLFNGDGTEDCADYKYVIASKTKEKDARVIAKYLNETCSGRGGGKPDMVQGAVKAKREKIQESLDNSELL